MNEQQNVSRAGETSVGHQADKETSEDRSEFTLTPDVDIYEDEKGIHISADMPGVSRERLDIQVNQDALTIEGEAKIDMPEDMEAMYADIRSTQYRRTFVLSGELDAEHIDARLREGVLDLYIPKRAEAVPRKVEVTAG